MALDYIFEGTQGQNVLLLGTGTVLSVLFLAALTRKLVAIYKFYKFHQNLPGTSDRSYLWGHLHKLPSCCEDRLNYTRKRMEENHGRYSCFWIGPFKALITVYHPELVKKVMKASATKSRTWGSPYNLASPWIGEGLIVANGERWARSRRLLTPAFHFDILKDYLQIFNEVADRLLVKLDRFAETGESFDICPLITLCTLEVILKCSLGFDGDIQGKGHPYVAVNRELAEIFIHRVRSPWLWPDFIFRLTAQGKKFFKNCDFVQKFAEEIIEKRKEELNKENIRKDRHLDFIDILLSARDEDGKSMTTEEIRNEVGTFMFAGHDTTAASIPWIIYNLAKHKEYQEKVQEEVDDLVEGRDSPQLSMQDLSKLETLPLCIKETMRLYPPVPFIQRDLDVDVDFDGQKFPAGTTVTIAMVHLHKNRLIWDEPDEFRPERFQTENKSSVENFSFLPFSAGARNCIGQNFALNEEKVLLARIFQRYDVSIPQGAKTPKRFTTAVMKTDVGVWLTLKRR